jgi:DNA modification methylase
MVNIIVGDCLESLRGLDEKTVQTCVTSPPYYGLRDYGVDGQVGLEQTPEEYVAKLVAVFSEVRRVLKGDGTLWLNLGDSYAASQTGHGQTMRPKSRSLSIQATGKKVPPGLKPKDLIGIPWRVAFALQSDGWYLRSDIIWHKPNPMPESVTDRPTKAHEYLFLLSKSERYYYDHEAVTEPTVKRAGFEGSARGYGGADRNDGGRHDYGGRVQGTRNRRSVWTVTTQPYRGAHFATFPPKLIEPCILAGSRPDDIVLDPFGGAGTTGLVASRHGRRCVLLELNPKYAQLARERLANIQPGLAIA